MKERANISEFSRLEWCIKIKLKMMKTNKCWMMNIPKSFGSLNSFLVIEMSVFISMQIVKRPCCRLLWFCCFFIIIFYIGAGCRCYYDCHGNNNGNPITPLSWLQPSCCPFSSSLSETETETDHQHNRERQRQILFHHHPELNETAPFSRISKVCQISVLGSSVIRYRGASQ